MRPGVPLAALATLVLLGATGLAWNLAPASATSIALIGDAPGSITDLWQDAFSPPPVPYSLQVTVTDDTTGANLVSSSPAAIACDSTGSACRAGFDAGTIVTLTATDPLVDWGGACDFTSGTTCVPDLTANTVVEAVFP